MKEYMPEQTVDALTKHLADLANSVSLPDTVASIQAMTDRNMSLDFFQTNLQDRVRLLQEKFASYLASSSGRPWLVSNIE